MEDNVEFTTSLQASSMLHPPVEGARPFLKPKDSSDIQDALVHAVCSSQPRLYHLQGIDCCLGNCTRQCCHSEALT